MTMHSMASPVPAAFLFPLWKKPLAENYSPSNPILPEKAAAVFLPATKDHALAAANCQKHSPLSPLIFGKIHPEDEIVEASQKSFLLPFEQLHLDLSAISPALPPAAGQIQPYIRPQ